MNIALMNLAEWQRQPLKLQGGDMNLIKTLIKLWRWKNRELLRENEHLKLIILQKSVMLDLNKAYIAQLPHLPRKKDNVVKLELVKK